MARKKLTVLEGMVTKNEGGIDNLLQSFGIDGLDKENHFNPNEDDISDWFGGAPGWLRRS